MVNDYDYDETSRTIGLELYNSNQQQQLVVGCAGPRAATRLSVLLFADLTLDRFHTVPLAQTYGDQSRIMLV